MKTMRALLLASAALLAACGGAGNGSTNVGTKPVASSFVQSSDVSP